MTEFPTVQTLMNYSSEAEGQIGYWFHEPAPEKKMPLYPAGQDRHIIEVRDAWPIAETAPPAPRKVPAPPTCSMRIIASSP